MARQPAPARNRAGERGILMAGVMVLIAIMLIFSTIAFQGWEDTLRRDNEAEMIFRAQEIVRALIRQRKDKGSVPQKLEELLEPGTKAQYYIRQLYKDPLVKDGKWGVLYIGPGGGILDPNAPPEDLSGGESPLGLGSFAADDSASGRGQGQAGRPPRDPGAGPAFRPLDSSDGGESAAGGQELSGMPIAGVRSLCTEKPFRVYKGHSDYAKWWFTILDYERPVAPGGQRPPPPGGPGGGTGQGPGGDRPRGGAGGGR